MLTEGSIVCREVRRNGRAFTLGKMRIPRVDDQDRAPGVAVVPRFVLYRVIESKGLALHPLTHLSAYPESAAWRHVERKVDNRAGIGDTGVCRDVAVRLQNREERIRRAARNPCERQVLQNPGGVRASFNNGRVGHAIFP